MRIVFLGSGAFGLPSLAALIDRHDVLLVVTQPDRPAGRSRHPAPTPIGEFAAARQRIVVKPENVNEPAIVDQIRALNPHVNVVIAYGQKIGSEIRAIAPTINLHGSLLPKYRGAAPIQRAVMNAEAETGVSIIDVADRMDAGAVYGKAATPVSRAETAGELHDRLALLGPGLLLDVLDQIRRRIARPQPQDESAATRAPKLTKELGTVGFDQPAERVRAVIHGLTPWPGCTVLLDGQPLKLLRVEVVAAAQAGKNPPQPAGRLTADGLVICGDGAIRLLEVQLPGGKAMSFESYARGRRIAPGAQLKPVHEPPSPCPLPEAEGSKR